MKLHPEFFALLLCTSLAFTGCNSKPDTDLQEQEAHATQPKPAPVASPPNLRDTLQRLARQLDTVHRDGCWDEDFARLMSVRHAGAQRLAAVEVSQGKDSTLRILGQHVLKGHERDNHVFILTLPRQPPKGQEYRPGNAKDPFVRRITDALAPCSSTTCNTKPSTGSRKPAATWSAPPCRKAFRLAALSFPSCVALSVPFFAPPQPCS